MEGDGPPPEPLHTVMPCHRPFTPSSRCCRRLTIGLGSGQAYGFRSNAVCTSFCHSGGVGRCKGNLRNVCHALCIPGPRLTPFVPIACTHQLQLWGSWYSWAGGGRGLAWHLVVLLSAAGSAYWLLATYCCPSLESLPSIGGGTHRPLTNLCSPSPCLAYRYLPTPSFALVGRAHGAPRDFPCLTALCQVHKEEGNCPRGWPGVFKWTTHTGGGGSLPNGGFWAPGCPLAGSLP